MLELYRHIPVVPRRCTWEITLACNLRCGHCGSRAGAAREDELNTDEALDLCDQLAELGCQHVSLAGGEPTLRADWDAIVARLVGRGVRASLVSNGMTWDAALTAHAKRLGVYRVGFSLDGLEATHDCARRVQQGHEKVLAAIRHCTAAEIETVAITTVTRHNVDELEQIHAELGEAGATLWQVQLGVPQGNLAEDPEAIVGQDEIVALLPRLAAIKRSGRRPQPYPADNVGYYSPEEEELRAPGKRLPFWVGCRAGLEVLGIESNGNVKGCLSLPSELNGRTDYIEGNLRERSLAEIWNDPNAFAYNRQFDKSMLHGACRDCAWGEICRGGCTWTSTAHHGQSHRFSQCYYLHTEHPQAAKGAEESA